MALGGNIMALLQNFKVRRDGAYVVIQWDGAPRFTVGVYVSTSDHQALEQAAKSIERGDRSGLDPDQLAGCVRLIRRQVDKVRRVGI